MLKKRWIRWTLALLSLPPLLILAGWLWLKGIDFSHSGGDPQARRADLGWVPATPSAERGRILAVVSSAERMLGGSKRAGYELTELSRAWWVFEAAGFAIDIASPQGGKPPQVLDDDLVDADYAFLNEPDTQAAVRETLRLDEIDPARYAAVYIVGGKGAMLDLHGDPALRRILAEVYDAGGVLAAVCHGPAALIGVELAEGRSLLAGRQVTGFSNAEELFLIDDPVHELGFMLQDGLAAQAQFIEGPMYLENVVRDGRVLTGQNPWSTWALAEETVRALGVEPAPRPRSSEERAVDLMHHLHRHGLDAARDLKSSLGTVDNRLLLMHALIAGMRRDIGRMVDLARLARD
ncbi:type 1 glutamine amidotransferase domain-containing protein [Pseudomarimonas salicorniae]|uniref:Type 1 glutamine amidotransferase domain-containing protein n=1 Tax=Pseudomarimonas salicorniae TaxID=2933270 RepID=A0ABT0GII7_9GAMM|nr:type 1 glutamine amidotransferase domain-containing protein [Lysobacter sp. CAU 1642]MCK7594167.1 type 1 glutamine amidotransferase domain-containing protein [Lysobacter sp. CAU 1642]